MILGFLWGMLKMLLVICGILIITEIIVSLIMAPFEKRKQQKNIYEFLNALDDIVKEAIIELEKEEKEKKTKKKSTKNITKKKEK